MVPRFLDLSPSFWEISNLTSRNISRRGYQYTSSLQSMDKIGCNVVGCAWYFIISTAFRIMMKPGWRWFRLLETIIDGSALEILIHRQ
jgi:hypothetical protein